MTKKSLPEYFESDRAFWKWVREQPAWSKLYVSNAGIPRSRKLKPHEIEWLKRILGRSD